MITFTYILGAAIFSVWGLFGILYVASYIRAWLQCEKMNRLAESEFRQAQARGENPIPPNRWEIG